MYWYIIGTALAITVSWNLPSTPISICRPPNIILIHVWLARSTLFPWQGRPEADQQQVLVQGSRTEMLPRRWPWNILSLPPSVRCLRTEATVH